MILAILIGIFAGIFKVFRFIIDIIKAGLEYAFNKVKFIVQLVQRDTEVLNNITSRMKERKHYSKINNQL